MRYASLRQGLVGCWCPSVSGPYGYRLPDLSGYGNHGTLTNMDPGSDWVVGGGKGALDFDGSNDYVVSNVVYKSANNWSISAWVKPNAVPGRSLFILNGRGQDGYGFGIGNGSGGSGSNFEGLHGGITWINSGYTFPSANQWYHLVATRDNSATRFYVFGIQTTQVSTGSIAAPTQSTYIGADGNNSVNYTTGQLDDIRIYNRALTEQEIRLLASERGIGLKPERQRNRYLVSALPSRNRSSRFLGFPS